MDASVATVQPVKPLGHGNLPVTVRVVVRTRDGIEQAEGVETLAGDIAE